MGVKKKTSNQGMDVVRRDLRQTQSEGSSRQNQGTRKAVPDTGQDEARERVWQIVAMIPRGHVASYGQIARLAGMPAHARFVGATLRNLPANTRLPWHRVVNAALRISQRGGGEARILV